MRNVKLMQFGEICHVYQPETISKKSLPVSGIYPVYGANGKIGFNDNFNHKEPQLLLGCRGSVGTVHISEPYSWINGNAMVVRPFENLITRDYLKYALLGGINIKDAISGTAQPQITRESLSRIKVPVPVLERQLEIVAKLEGAFAEIDNLSTKKNQQLANSRELFRAVCKTQIELLNPSSYLALKELSSLITKGTTPTTLGHKFKDVGVNFIKVEAIDESGNLIPEKFDFIDDFAHKALLRSQLRENDVLVSITGALGRSALIGLQHIPANISQNLALVRLLDESKITHRYLASLFLSDYFELNQIGAGVAQQALSLGQIGSLQVPILTPKNQAKFIDFIKDTRQSTEILYQNLNAQQLHISELKSAILFTEFNGAS